GGRLLGSERVSDDLTLPCRGPNAVRQTHQRSACTRSRFTAAYARAGSPCPRRIGGQRLGRILLGGGRGEIPLGADMSREHREGSLLVCSAAPRDFAVSEPPGYG